MVNLYSGNAPQGIKGEIRLAIDHDTYGMPFTLNRAEDKMRIQIDPLEIIGLR